MKIFKKLFGIFAVTTAFAIYFLPETASAQYQYSNSGNAITITKYTGSGGSVTIPSTIDGFPVTVLGDYAFSGISTVTAVTIPNSVTTIGYATFYQCSGLTGVTIGTGVTSIGASAFEQCTNLSSFAIGYSITSIGNAAFQQSGLTNITIPATVISIGNDVFWGCPSLTSVTVLNAIIGQTEFSTCPVLTSATLGDNLTSVGYAAFYQCPVLSTVTIGKNATSIGASAFEQCPNLTHISLPNSVISIGNAAFQQSSSLTKVYFQGNAPASVGSDVFYGVSYVTVYCQQGATGFGSTFAGAPVVVLGPPIITSQPAGSTNLVGTSTTFSVGVSPLSGSFSYQWQLNGTNLPAATSNPLFLSNLALNQAGNYAVVVSDAFGTVTSSPAYLEVVFVPVYITEEPMSQVVPLGGTASFTVSASGYPAPSYQWRLDGINLAGATSSTFTITNVDIPNVGNYQVLINNIYSTNNSYIVTLNIPPTIVAPFTGAITIWGTEASLSVAAVGSGTLNYQWYMDGSLISGATGPMLNFDSIQFTNAGLYSVSVTSSYGTVTNEAYQVVVNPANIALGFYPGLSITGAVGYSYVVQSSTNLSNTNAWITLENLTLTNPVQLFVDTNVDATSPFNSKVFYRVLPGQ